MDEDEVKGKGKQIKGKIREETRDLLYDEEWKRRAKLNKPRAKHKKKLAKLKEN